MAENKTQKTKASVTEFLNTLPDEQKRQDSFTLLQLFTQISGSQGAMWGPAMIGFGDLRYKYASGREGDWFKAGFSPRKQNLTVYISGGLPQYANLLNQLGKHKTGVGCIYINKLSDIDLNVLKEIIAQAFQPTG